MANVGVRSLTPTYVQKTKLANEIRGIREKEQDFIIDGLRYRIA
jgi:hypothetical protein